MKNIANYTQHNEILSDLGRNFRNRQWEEADVIEWCQHVETRVVPDVDYMVKYKDYPVTVENGLAKIPCFAYKVFNFSKTPGMPIDSVKPTMAEAYISVYNDIKFGDLYLNFVGMPVDEETGIPFILKGHEQLCYWYCVQSAFTEAYLDGDIDANRWAFIEDKVTGFATQVKQSLRHWTDEDYAMMSVILGTDLAYLGGYKHIGLR